MIDCRVHTQDISAQTHIVMPTGTAMIIRQAVTFLPWAEYRTIIQPRL